MRASPANHAHVYYDPATGCSRRNLWAAIERRFELRLELRLERWRDEPIGPHPCGRYQIAFAPELFGELIP